MVLLCLPLLVTALVVPKFEEIFKDFGVALPWLTRVEIQVGRLASSPAGWVLMLGVMACVLAPAAWAASRRRAWAAMLLALAVLVGVGYVLLLVLGMFLPLTTLIESLQQGGGKP